MWRKNTERWSYLIEEWFREPWRFRIHGTSLPHNLRYVGASSTWYDGVIWSIGFWWGHFYIIEG